MAIALEMRLDQVASREVLNRLAGRLEDRSELNARIGGYLEAVTRNRFLTQTGPDGQRWTPSIRARMTGGLTLRDRGGLEGSITSVATAETVEVGTNKIYGALMQNGGVVEPKTGKVLHFTIPGVGEVFARRVRIPGRPYLGIGEADQKGLDEVVFDYLAEAAPR
jgi:phage virion morphogenesis protein